ncbi:hypothetical protein LJC49_04235 [Ruminococcaceae bacterium OttesenSCG-928-I18]|nr:hypothetical protein [Ruminococcaceae bacterium OttesenSCG-928-I18]
MRFFRGIALGLATVFSLLLAGCGQTTRLGYEEFSVYAGGELLATAPQAVSAPGHYDSYTGHIGQTYAPDGGPLNTYRGIGIGSSLEDFERYYGEVEFTLVEPETALPQPLEKLLRDIDPYGEITLQTYNYFSLQRGTPEEIDAESFEKAEAWGENVQLIRMNFLLVDGNVSDIQLFIKARL